MDINKAREYIDFLINDIEDYKRNWQVEESEIQKFIIEFERFKKLIKNSIDIPYQIKEKIANTTFSYNRLKMWFKFLIRYIFYNDAIAYRKIQIEGKYFIEGYCNRLLSLRREIELYQYRHNPGA